MFICVLMKPDFAKTQILQLPTGDCSIPTYQQLNL